MSTLDYDVVIIGGGPAGSTTGTYLALAGLRVLIIEKARFPRFHIGESIMPVANAILQETGVWNKVEQAGFVRKHGAEFHVSNKSVLPRHVEFARGLLPGLDYTFQVERADFDHILLDHAAEAGCEVRQETKASRVEAFDDGSGYRVTVQTASQPDATRFVTASYLVDASGRDQLFEKPIQTAPANPELAKRLAIYAHFTNVPRTSGKTAGNILIIRNADGWAWFIPLRDRVSVGVVVSTGALRNSRLKPEAFFWKTVGESSKLAGLLATAEQQGQFHVTADYNYRARKFATPRMLLVGDAACFLDPMFSTGVFLALLSAKLAAQELISAHRAGLALSRWHQWRYTRQLSRNVRNLERLVLAFYDNQSFSVFMERNAPLRMVPAINSLVAGHANPPWAVRWRYWLFLLVCRLQRVWNVVPSVSFEPPTPSLKLESALHVSSGHNAPKEAASFAESRQ